MRRTVHEFETIDISTLRAVVTLAREGSFSGAARSLSVPKASFWRRITALERALGIRLAERTTRELHLTDEGKRFATEAARALLTLDSARQDATSATDTPVGLVRISAPPDLAAFALGTVAAELKTSAPHVRLEVYSTTKQVDLVRDGFDLAVRASPALRDSTLVAKRAGSIVGSYFASPSYAASLGRIRTLADLVPHVNLALDTATGQVRAEQREGVKDGASAIHVCANDFTFLKAACVAGAGVARLPLFVCAQEARDKQLVRILPKHSESIASAYVVQPTRERQQPKRVTLVRDLIVAVLSERLPRE